jgi:hypothetical protein
VGFIDFNKPDGDLETFDHAKSIAESPPWFGSEKAGSADRILPRIGGASMERETARVGLTRASVFSRALFSPSERWGSRDLVFKYNCLLMLSYFA